MPMWIWSVVAGDVLHARDYNGQRSRRCNAAMRQKAWRIVAVGMTKEVSFEPTYGPINERIDDAYHAEYRGSPCLDPMITDRALRHGHPPRMSVPYRYRS